MYKKVKKEKFDEKPKTKKISKEPMMEVVFFMSPTCAYCARFLSEVWKKVAKQIVDPSGKLVDNTNSPFFSDKNVNFYTLTIQNDVPIKDEHNITKVPTLGIAYIGGPLITTIGIPDFQKTVQFINYFKDTKNYIAYSQDTLQQIAQYQSSPGS